MGMLSMVKRRVSISQVVNSLVPNMTMTDGDEFFIRKIKSSMTTVSFDDWVKRAIRCTT